MIGIISVLIISAVAGGIYQYSTRPVLSAKKLVIYTGYEKTIYLYGRYEVNAWSSDNEEIALVKNGRITALAPGNVHITADTGKKKFVCEVEVRESLSPFFYQMADEEKNWLFAQQLSNGAFCNRIKDNGKVSINPYFSAQGVWCALQCDLTEEEQSKIKKYLQWHFEHINYKEDYNGMMGTIYDYKAEVKDGKVIEEYTDEKYDSTDSYAAVFLSVLWKYYEKTGDSTYLFQHKDSIDLIKEAMLSTLSECYTYCKPDYKIVYLMDNAEVYEGIISTEKIYREVFQNEKGAKQMGKIKKKFMENFNSTWWRGDHYSPYLDQNYGYDDDKFSWKNFYADAVSQFAPILYDLADEKKSETVYKKFCNTWNWEEMDYYYKDEAEFYWGMLMYGAVKMKDYDRAGQFLELYRSETQLREYPLIFSDCAWVMLGAEKLGDYYKNIELSCN